MDPRLLTENGWKAIVSRFRIRDNGLQRALSTYEKLGEEEYDERLAGIASVVQLAGGLKRDRTVGGAPPVVKYLTDMAAAAEAQKREIARAKAQAAKTAEAAARRREQNGGDEEEEGQGTYHEKLVAAFQKLKSCRDLSYQFIVCDARPHCGLMLAKRITSQHREELGRATGSRRFLHVGTCRWDTNRFSFSMDQPVSGLARKLQDSIKHFTGKRFPIAVGTESADDNNPQPAASQAAEQPEQIGSPRPGIGASARPAAGARPNGPAPEQSDAPSPPGRATLAGAPAVWRRAEELIATKINQLKAAIRREFAEEAPDLVETIESNITRLDQILGTFDHRLSDSLTNAQAAQGPAARASELNRAKLVLADVIRRVKSEPLIAQIDANPFGVQINLRRTLTAVLTHIAQAIGRVGAPS